MVFYFNSIKVRLKHVFGNAKVFGNANFNSIKVQFKLLSFLVLRAAAAISIP